LSGSFPTINHRSKFSAAGQSQGFELACAKLTLIPVGDAGHKYVNLARISAQIAPILSAVKFELSMH